MLSVNRRISIFVLLILKQAIVLSDSERIQDDSFPEAIVKPKQTDYLL